ncbi:MAG: L-lactate dehydrogenase [Clostridia bacterium]|nr:L-lactate dehydrogenase [Clostridia bacterium]
MNRKVTIIGAGAVGSSIGYLLVAESMASEIVFIDINKEKALGEAMDIYQATPFLSPAIVRAGDYHDAENSDLVIITSGVARKPGQTRIDLAQTNVNILKSIAPEITKYAPDAIYIIVANPVDVLTYTFHQITNIPSERIIGSGTSLDTARLRTRLSEIYKVSPKQVHANVLGEHGDTSFIPWSMARIAGVPLEEYSAVITDKENGEVNFSKEEVLEYVKKSGGVIIARKGATYNGVAAAVVYICKALFSGVDSILCVSTLLKGEYGIKDVCISIPVVLGKEGIVSTLTPTLTDEEVALLQKSADAMKSVINEVNCK